MTNEKAREVLQEQIDKYGQEYDAEGIEALEVAIRALSSWTMYSDELWKKAYVRGCNDVLAMIRAEIEEVSLNISYKENHKVGGSWGLRKAMEIIDKYIAESEG